MDVPAPGQQEAAVTKQHLQDESPTLCNQIVGDDMAFLFAC